MRSNILKSILIKSGLSAAVLLVAHGAALAQVNLTAGPATATLPDGTAVPMWGYSCGAVVAPATCTPLNPVAAAAGGWSPVVITVPTGTDLTVNLTNNLSFTPATPAGAAANNVPTSLTIVGQIGGGLGVLAQRTTAASPTHAPLSVTWPTTGTVTGAPPTFTPPPQLARVQSFATEVVVGTTIPTGSKQCASPCKLTWTAPRPGTYLIESGTHPSIQGPMGLYGILVVTAAPTATAATATAPSIETAVGTAYPGVSYDAEVPLLLSEIDPLQNNAVNTAVNTAGFSETAVITLRDAVSSVGLTLDSSGNPINAGLSYSVNDPVVFTGGGGTGAAAIVSSVDSSGAITGITVTSPGTGYTSVPLVMVNGTGAGALISAALSLGGNVCSTGTSACYPPAVNYTPLYYLFNGVAFNKTSASTSLFSVTPAQTLSATGSVLVRFVNAGLHMHVPSIVGAQTTTATPTGSTAPTITSGGFALIAEDGNPLPGIPRVQSEVFLAPGKTYDVMINVPAAGAAALPVYDRELSLSGNAVGRDAGMLAYIGVNGAVLPASPSMASATANPDTYNAVVAGQTLTISDAGKGVMANDVNVYGVKVITSPTQGTLTLNTNGTFTYVANTTWDTTKGDSFTYCGNGATSGAACATVTLGAGATETAANITLPGISFTANMATYLAVKTPGLLTGAKDGLGLPLTIATTSLVVPPKSGLTVVADANGGFTATAPSAGTYTFTYEAQNSQGTLSAPATATLIFPAASGLTVTVLDGSDKVTTISDYRWVIEEDRTFYIDPKCIPNPPPAGCPTAASGIVPTFGVNFHTSYMPFVAQGCTGPLSCEGGQTVLGQPSVCDVGNGNCRPDATGNGQTPVLPGQVALDPTKRYYISVLPGDSANPFATGYGGAPADCANTGATTNSSSSPTSTCGHGMGGAPITFAQTAVTVLTQPSPYPPAKLSVFVFEDDFPLNGEQDGGGGIDVLSPNEPGLGGFQIHLWDAMGGNGDFTGQMTYDMFNMPLTNSLDGTIDPATGKNACPITKAGAGANGGVSGNGGITGMIVTCPKYEGDGTTLSPLAGQAVIANLMPGRFGVIATPAADRIARGEEWLQTNTLDGQKAHDSFVRIGEPAYFQEFGPAGYHVSVGFANPAIINGRKAGICSGNDPNSPNPGSAYDCSYTITGRVVGEHLSRTPDERLYGTGSHDAFYWTQCYVSFGDPDGEDFSFTKCNADGTFTMTGLPAGSWRVTTFDQWNDQLVDGLSTPVGLGVASGSNCQSVSAKTCNMGDIAATQWQTNLYTRTFIDDNKDGISQKDENGIPLANVAVRLRDGSLENLQATDFTGTANFNETFPLFSWYTVETDVTRYKNTGTHVVYDVGGPVDGTTCSNSATPVAGYPPCGKSAIGNFLANTAEQVSVPTNLRVPGAVYCKDADCSTHSTGILGGPGSSDPPSVCTTSNGGTTCSTQLSSGRIDPPWVGVEGWQGFPGQNNFIEFGKEPYVPGENGGIKGHVIYASTRPFDDPQMLVQTQWEPLIPHVTINLYQEGVAADGVTPTLTLVDHTQTSSWDDYAQGFHKDANGNTIPNMNCPGQGGASGPLADLFFFSIQNQPQYLDFYNSQHGGAAPTALPSQSQYKCYDGMHNWNQLQPAPYDGMYQFPSVTATDPTTGKPTASNCTICTANNVVPATDLYHGLPMLPAGKYVVEVVVPPGLELVKEEDKNILIGDNYIAPATNQFGGLGDIFIIPDQASLASTYNANNPQNPTQSLGAQPNNGIVPGFAPEPTWPCVGEKRIVPDYISLYPQTHQVSPFAGATRSLCDRKEVTLGDEMGAIAKFYLFTSTHIASKFTGGITDDYTSEFDPFSPQFGEKFSPPDLPVSIKDWAGNETNRVYADHWGAYNGMTYSTWEVNPPNPTGYAPTMMVVCMNDPGTGPIPDPLYSTGYSQFCYELPFMPGTTQYLDTPVVPTSAFAGAGYNNPDCAYPDATPAVASVIGSDGIAGPWVKAAGSTLTITSLGDQQVPNNAYSGPQAATAPYNTKTILRHYGFGAAGTVALVGSDNVPHALTGVVWNDAKITGTVPLGVPNCAVQQNATYQSVGGLPVYTAAGSPKGYAQCGQLVITTGAGKQSIDTVTVTIGGKTPTVLNASNPLLQYSTGAIQNAIDAAAPGDMIIVPPGVYNEMILMWKPVRLQGVGAASSVINANTQPAGKLDPWRREVNCLFGLALDGTPISNKHAYDSTSTYSCGSSANFTGSPTTLAYFAPQTLGDGTLNPQVDRLPLEATVGWDATLNGNLAELLQEPSLMGALEGAGITVLSKGVNFPSNPFASDTFPTGTTLLTASNCATSGTSSFPSSFQCNPSSIDGLGITDSSQGGGGIFVHGWGHNLQIANNRILSNAGTLSGGINIGQGEFPPSYLSGAAATNAPPGSCQPTFGGGTANVQQPYCHNLNVNVHHNSVSLNSSTGDELFSGTPAGAGGVSFCTGSDYYKFQYNWVCGNLSSGDGGGFGHLGFSFNGDIEHNTIVFNQSLNPTIPANGGGLIIMGAPDVDPTCGATTDIDCVPTPGSVGPSDGVGPGLVINANLIMGNSAESGTGGGIAFQNVNGSDVVNFPANPAQWYTVTVTNNIIADNVAGWDGAGISLLDALKINIINNTIASNSTTASAGILFNTLGGPVASQQGPTCTSNCGVNSAPQPAGLVSIQNSVALSSNLPAAITCPADHYAPGSSPTSSSGNTANGWCRYISYPEMYNNVFWQNSAFYVSVGTAVQAQFQQNVVTLMEAVSKIPAPSQSFADSSTGNGGGTTITGGTGACVQGQANYWDIGVRGDTAPGNHSSNFSLAPQYSILTNSTENAKGSNNVNGNPDFTSQYCDGSRTPPELGLISPSLAAGWQVPPGISDATVPNPVFNLTPAATVDEGNNWINLRWGPLSVTNPTVQGTDGNYGGGAWLGNYAPASGSSAINEGVVTIPNGTPAPTKDFFGNNRAAGGPYTAGAIEVAGATLTHTATVSPTSLSFGNWAIGSTSSAKTVTVTNTGTGQLTGFALGGLNTRFSRPGGAAGGTCGNTLAVGANCTINIVFSPNTPARTITGSMTVGYTGATVTGSPVALTGTGVTGGAALAATPSPANITLATGVTSGTAVVTLKNNAATGGSQVAVTGVSYTGNGSTGTGANRTTWMFGTVTGQDACTGTTLAPGATCQVTVQFVIAGPGRGTHNGTIRFADSGGTTNPVDNLVAIAN
jgi:hypothetical protein